MGIFAYTPCYKTLKLGNSSVALVKGLSIFFCPVNKLGQGGDALECQKD